MGTIVGVLFVWLGVVTGVAVAARRVGRSRLAQGRVFDATPGGPPPPPAGEARGPLGRWMALAGYRSPGAAGGFALATGTLLALGVGAAYAAYASGVVGRAVRLLGQVPGGVGEVLLPAAYLAPWFALLLPACLPWLVVRAARRRRVAEIEQDLPIALELLATLAEAGLGFDAALERILASQPPGRPLAEEFRVFQLELLAGRSRVRTLRGLARRIEVPAVSVLVSALVQADQVGAGTADVLRRQADDLRNRRRENALTKAASLPVKLLFPLIVCFLPGVMLAALGPPFYQIFQLLETNFPKAPR